MPIDPNPLVWQDGPGGLPIPTATSAANFNRITAEVASEIDERIAVQAAADTALYMPLGTAMFDPIAHTTVMGAPSGADDSAAITSAIAAAVTACQADGTNICRIVLRAGIYVASRALVQDTPATGIYRNSQIPLPWVPKTAEKVTLIIDGAAPAGIFPMYGQTVKQSEGTVISSSLTGQTFDATRFYPSIMGGVSAAPGLVFTNINLIVRNLTFRAPNNPSLVGLDCGYMGHTDIEDVRFDTDVVAGQAYYSGTIQTAIAVPTAPTGIAYIAARTANNPIHRMRRASFSGWYAAVWCNEHLDADNLTVVKCRVAIALQGVWGHTARFGYVSAEHCLYAVAAIDQTGVVSISGSAYLTIDYLDMEDKASPTDPWATIAHIYDPGNGIRGRIRTHQGVEGIGATNAGLVQVGGHHIALDNAARQVAPQGPAGIAPSFWLRADRTFVANAATVATWTDAAKGLTATTGAGTPIMTSDGIGGRPAVTFSGSPTAYLDTPARSASSTPLTIVCVVNFTDFVDYRALAGVLETSSGGIDWRPDKDGQPNARHMQLLNASATLIASAGTALAPSTNYVLGLTLDAAGNYAFYLNGAPDGSGSTATAITAGKHRRVGASEGALAPMKGALAEYIEWDYLLTSGEMLAVALDLGAKYGITGDTITPGYTNSYRDPVTVPGQPLRFWRLGGIAYAEGEFENGASVSPGVNVQYPAGQLPTGWRPQFTVTRVGMVNIAGVGFGATNARVEPTGVVSWQAYATGGPYAAGAVKVSIARISWPIYS